MTAMIFTPALNTPADAHEHLARTILVLRGRPYNYDDNQGLGHAEPYGEAEQAWDDAAERIEEVEMDADDKGVKLDPTATYQAALKLELADAAAHVERMRQNAAQLARDLASTRAAIRDASAGLDRMGLYSQAAGL